MPVSDAPWFPVGRDNTDGWRLDVVGILAILGESLMASHIQPLSASILCMLPRLLPAPQSFLKYTRESKLPSRPATVCGVHSGVLPSRLNYFANILIPISGLKAFQVEVWEITCAQHTLGEDSSQEPIIPPHTLSPVNILTVISSGLTIGAIFWAMAIHDGAAVFALSAMSVASTLIGIASYWKPRLSSRPGKVPVPPGDVVIRTESGAFLIVRCSEEIARELYTGAENGDYLVNDQWAKGLLGCSTLLVIASVIFLGNCSWTMQVVIAVIYVTLNALYWVASLLPPKWLWDLSRYKLKQETPEHIKDAHKPYGCENKANFTRSLWYAILATKEVDWITYSNAAPKHPAWNAWLKEAYANRDNENWDAIGVKDELMGEIIRNPGLGPDERNLCRQGETSRLS